MLFKFDDYLPDFTTETEIKDSLKRALGKFFNCNHVILVVNGTTAIEIALKALGLKRGTPVIVPDLSFIATATAVANCGLIPVYADISAEYYGLTLESVKQEYTQHQNTGAVVLVHFGGYVNREIFAIKAFCAAHHLYLLEDCAQGCRDF
jgi:perosamine synthetase